ncbi:MAG: RNA polymerase sigma factor, partial [Candidatus Uhrbacteria bacterium]
SGELGLYRVLVERYISRLRRYTLRLLLSVDDAEDVVQDVLLKAYANLRGFDTKRSFSTWIYRIAHNECVNALKKRHREPVPFFDPDVLFPHPVAKETAADAAERDELLNTIERFLEQLDPKYREVVVLHYIEERPYKEIADILRVPISTVGVRLKRARDHLQRCRTREA